MIREVAAACHVSTPAGSSAEELTAEILKAIEKDRR